jgi:hypothetical protein
LIRVIDGCPPKRDWEKVKEMVGRGERFSTGKLLRTSWSHGSAEFALANSRLMAIEATTDGVRAGAARAGDFGREWRRSGSPNWRLSSKNVDFDYFGSVLRILCFREHCLVFDLVSFFAT